MARAPARGAPGAATRALAARAVEQVIGAGRILDEALAGLDLAALSGPDRAQVRALAYGALRGHHRHRALLRLILDRPLPTGDRRVEALLSVGCFQLLDEAQPDYAAVSATVAAARVLGLPRVAGLVNAALRRLQRERDALLARAAESPEGRWSHPAWLVARLRADWPGEWQPVLEANQRPPPLWLRVNLARTSREAFSAGLAAAGIAHAAGDLPEAVRLDEARAVAEIPGFAAGEASVQDLAAQLAARLLAPRPGERVLDACAAPGGKATHLLELAGGDLDLLAMDVDATRLRRVDENLARLGLAARTLAADAARPADWWDGRPFDRVLVDAPCSGTGVVRRHPDIKALRRETDIAPFAQRQLALLEALWPTLRPGGHLLYATCSVLREENAGVAARFLATHPDAREVQQVDGLPAWAAARGGPGWQALPGTPDTDGLYYALMARQPA